MSWYFCVACIIWELVMKSATLVVSSFFFFFMKPHVFFLSFSLNLYVWAFFRKQWKKMVLNDVWSELLIFALQSCRFKLLIFTVVGDICKECQFPVCFEVWQHDPSKYVSTCLFNLFWCLQSWHALAAWVCIEICSSYFNILWCEKSFKVIYLSRHSASCLSLRPPRPPPK